MKSAKNVIKQTLASLERKNLEATPVQYEKEFFEISEKIKFDSDDYNNYKEILNSLENNIKSNMQENNLIGHKELLIELIKNQTDKNSSKNIENLAEILISSLQPSISNENDKNLISLIKTIKENNSSILESNLQTTIKNVIAQRILIDKNIYETNMKEVEKLSGMLNSQITHAILNNKQSGDNMSKITKKILKIEKPSIENLNKVQTQLVFAAKSIERNITNTNNKLEKSKNEITSLQNKITELENELDSTKKENEIDHLTSLYTRKAYDKYANIKEKQFLRNKTNYAIVFFDIDHFKNVNDTYGHEGGDIILATFAKVLLNGTRDTEIVGRYGGEEFVALIDFKEQNEIESYIARIKKVVTTNQFVYKEHKINITFSAGVTIRDKNVSYEATLNLADELLYKAKNSGRNKIVFQNGVEL